MYLSDQWSRTLEQQNSTNEHHFRFLHLKVVICLKVFIRLPWLGPASSAFENQIRRVTNAAIPFCKPVCVFTIRKMLSTGRKDRLPAEQLSNVTYLYNCARGHNYGGRTTQRLEERIKQHVPASFLASARCPEDKESTKSRKETAEVLMLAQAGLKGRSEVLAPSPRRARRRRPKRRRRKLGQTLAQAQVPGYFDRELDV